MIPLLPSEFSRTFSPPWPDLALNLAGIPIPSTQIQRPEQVGSSHAPPGPGSAPGARAGHAGSRCVSAAPRTAAAPVGRARSPGARPPGGGRQEEGQSRDCRVDSGGPMLAAWCSALLTVTALPCSSRTATPPSSTATSWVQATPLRPRLSLVTCTLWRERPRCSGQQGQV